MPEVTNLPMAARPVHPEDRPALPTRSGSDQSGLGRFDYELIRIESGRLDQSRTFLTRPTKSISTLATDQSAPATIERVASATHAGSRAVHCCRRLRHYDASRATVNADIWH